ncbi:MAG: flippase-like domain-containing protein [Saccharothrix sp.]|nr:flippase-like domain-containing protein [Saccharothrix sp.]
MTRGLRVVASLASPVLAAWLVIALVPVVGGVTWSAVGDRLREVGPGTALGLTALWLAGLWAYTYVLTGSLPGLRHTQAFSLNAAGSAISNVLPFGGAAGVAVTAVMASSWGYSAHAITTSAVVSGLWNTAARVALPLLALAVHGPAVPTDEVLVAAVTAIGVLGLVAVVLLRPRWFGGRATRFLLRLRGQTGRVVREGWRRMTLGMLAYLLLQGVLLWWCLAAAGVQLTPGQAVATFAVSRLLTLAVITPGGVGVTENGTIAVLVGMGAPAAPSVAGVLLFTCFTYLAEIPLGGAAWLGWTARRARSG